VPDLLDIVAEFRAAMLRQDEAAVKRLVEVYGRSWKRLDALVQALAEKIGNEAPTRGQVTRMMQYKNLQAQIEEELTGLQAITRDMVSEQGALNVAAGERDAARLVGATLTGDARILPGYNHLHPEAIVNMLGFLDPQGALYKRISQLAPTTTDYVLEKLLEGVALGYNPTKTARAIRDAYGRGLTDSLRMVRTVQLYSYREANRASYAANSDVVKGWQWGAKLDGLTCMSCVAQHGTIHPLTETLNDHHMGRCAMIPVTSLFPPALDEDGKTWFERQPEAMQRKMMGNGKYEAWKEGKFSLSDLSVQRKDSVYGQMRGVPPLKDLVGGGGEILMADDKPITWQPSMTQEQAERWAKDSVYQDYLWHGSSRQAIQNIEEEGFRLIKGRNGKLFGEGIYLGGDPYTVERYGLARTKVKVNVQNILEIDAKKYADLSPQFRQILIDAGVTSTRTSGGPQRLTAYLQSKGYDALRLVEFPGEPPIMVVFDPKNIVVVK
jgi:hypothetical protein